VDAERLRHDMERLASEMHARGLVTVEP
jgi:hypothetical protein